MSANQDFFTPTSVSPQQTIESPFLSHKEFTSSENNSSYQHDENMEDSFIVTDSAFEESPFPSVFELENDATETADPEAEEMLVFLSEINDDEFDDAVNRLISETEGLLQKQFDNEEFLDPTAKAIAEKRIIGTHFNPLVQDVELFLDSLGQELEQYNLDNMTEAEFGELVDRYEPKHQPLSPAFEYFLGKLKKKFKKAIKRGFQAAKRGVKSVVRRGIQAAKKVGRYALKGLKSLSGIGVLKHVLKQLKRMVKPLLKQVLDKAINRIPSQYRPVAHMLKNKLLRSGFLKEFESVDEECRIVETQAGTIADITHIQRELDEQIAYLIYAEDEDAQEAALSEYETLSDQLTGENSLDTLDQARERFIREITELEEGEDPAPVLENFLPALLPALKLGIRLYGRGKIVNKLAKHVARLIRRFVGKKYTPLLSKMLVDAGMRLIHLETATPEDETQAAGAAVAATVEDTVRRVAAIPEYLLEDEALFEGAVLEAFEQAAAANLPQVLPENIYENRPELRETFLTKGTWFMRPLRSRRRRYKKFSKIFKVKISPHAARRLKTFRRIPLSVFLRKRYRLLPGQQVRAKVHLFEAIPGTRLNDIEQAEHIASREHDETLLHPLTAEAAGILLGEPGLGNREEEYSTTDQSLVPDIGQRYYYLEIAEAPSQPLPVTSSRHAERPSQLKLHLDFTGNQAAAFIFLSEEKSQTIAAKLRRNNPTGTVFPNILQVINKGIKTALTAQENRSVKIVHGAIPPEQSRGLAFKWLPPIILETMAAKLTEWLGQHVAKQLQQKPREFISATENLEDGVTIAVTLKNLPGFSAVSKLLRGDVISIRKINFTEGIPDVSSRIVPGLVRD